MATIVNETAWTLSASGTVTIPQPAAGNTLICASHGAATVACKSGANTWTKRAASLGTLEAACQDYVATGSGETAVTVTLNGAQPVHGVIFELQGLAAFVGAAAPASTTLTSKACTLAGITTTGNALMVSVFTFATTTHTTLQDQWWGLAPLGAVHQSGYFNAKWWAQVALSDLPGAGTYSASSNSLSAATAQAGAWVYADPSGTPTNPPAPNQIVAENSLPGTPTSQWFGVTSNSTIAGYTDSVSYLPGGTANFKVDSGGNPFEVQIYRVGAYAYAAFGARLVTTVIGAPAAQPAPVVDALGATVCAWSTTAAWQIPASACPGVYVALFRRTDITTNVSQTLFVVRSPAGSANRVAVLAADTTWQAYNAWGSTGDAGSSWTGRNLYGSNNNGNIAQRSNAVSYDRPYSTPASDAITSFWDSEISMINLLEACGYDLAYYSMADLDAEPDVLCGHQVVVINGHSEYWSWQQRHAVENAMAAGSNIFCLSSNTMLWRTRYAAADTARRYLICYKDTVSAAPLDPNGYTGTWRDAAVYNPMVWPESHTVGQTFLASAPNNGTHSWTADVAGLPCYRGTPDISKLTGSATYTCSVAGTIGQEIDYVVPGPGTPTNLIRLSHQQFNATSVAPAAGYPYTGSGTYTLGPSIHRRPNGSLVFAAGTWRLACGASPFRYSSVQPGGSVDLNVQQLLVNVLADFGAQPTTLLTAAANATAVGLVEPGPARSPQEYGLSVGPTGWGTPIR